MTNHVTSYTPIMTEGKNRSTRQICIFAYVHPFPYPMTQQLRTQVIHENINLEVVV